MKESVSYVSYFGSNFKTPDWARDTAAFLAHGVKRGWRVTLVLSHLPDQREWLQPLLNAGVEVESVPRALRNFDLLCITRVLRLCLAVKCHVFHCDNIHTSPLIGATIAGVPVRLWSKRSMEPSFEEERQPTLRDRLALSVRASCRLATQTLAVSSAIKEELRSLGISEQKLLVFSHYARRINLPRREDARRLFGFANSQIVIATVGHAVPVKGWDILLEVFAELLQWHPQLRLLLVGNFSDKSEQPFSRKLSAIVERTNIAQYVKFAGHLLDIGPALAATDIFVLPSRSEGFPFALIEAMTSGLACVSSAVGGARDLIDDCTNGFLVERGSVAQFGMAIRRLITEPDLRVRIGRAARSVRLPTFDEHAEKMFSLYEQLLKTNATNIRRNTHGVF
jgi:glycosyltransferase involved in cell wall biosynthesis